MVDVAAAGLVLTGEDKEIVDMVHDFVMKEVRPKAAEHDISGELDWDAYNKAFEMGLICADLPAEYGGQGLSNVTAAWIREELMYGDAGFGLTCGTNNLGIKPVLLAGTEEQKKWCVDILTSDRPGRDPRWPQKRSGFAAFALTEPDAGSDAGACKTLAQKVLDGDGSVKEYILNGRKCFITNACYADFMCVVASVDRSLGYKGLTMFLVDAHLPGVSIGKHEDKTWGKINGDKDVPYVEEMLVNAKFKAGNVKKLVNQQATKAAIVSAFKSLASQSKRGDMVYVHFSGHGQQMKDVHNDEKDGLDECWIPYDAYRKPCEKDKGEKHLTDDEVNYYLNAIRDKIGDSGKMLVVIDACHSGDATRGDEDEVVRGVEDIFEAIKTFIWGASTDKGKTDVNPNAQVNKERWITISACKSDQVNIEMKSPAVGKLTYAIYNKVKESTGNDNDDFFRRIRMFVNSNTGSRPQYPVMTGETDRFRTGIIQ